MPSLVKYIESTDWLSDLPEPQRTRDPAYEIDFYDSYHHSLYGIDFERVEQEVGLPYYMDHLVSTALKDFADTSSTDQNDELAEAIDEERQGNYGGESDIGPALRRFLRREIFFEAFWRELHKLLCSPDKSSEIERQNVLKKSNVGQSSVALSIAAAIAPTLGTSAGMIAGAISIALAIIARVGMSAWCETYVPSQA